MAETDVAVLTGEKRPFVEVKAIRSYEDYVWLREQLAEKHEDIVIPSLPPPESSKDIAVQRKHAAVLADFVSRVALIKDLASEEVFRIFTSDRELPRAKKGWGVSSLLSGVSKSLTETVTSSSIVDPDPYFEAQKSNLSSLQNQINEVIRAAERLRKAGQAFTKSLLETGGAATAFGEKESHALLGSGLRKYGRCYETCSDVFEKRSEHEFDTFVDFMKFNLRNIEATQHSLELRSRLVAAHLKAKTVTKAKKEVHDKLKLDSKTRADKLSKAATEQTDAEKVEADLHQQVEKRSEALRSELSRLELIKVEDFKAILLQYFKRVLNAEKEILSSWESLGPEIEAIKN